MNNYFTNFKLKILNLDNNNKFKTLFLRKHSKIMKLNKNYFLKWKYLYEIQKKSNDNWNKLINNVFFERLRNDFSILYKLRINNINKIKKNLKNFIRKIKKGIKIHNVFLNISFPKSFINYGRFFLLWKLNLFNYKLFNSAYKINNFFSSKIKTRKKKLINMLKIIFLIDNHLKRLFYRILIVHKAKTLIKNFIESNHALSKSYFNYWRKIDLIFKKALIKILNLYKSWKNTKLVNFMRHENLKRKLIIKILDNNEKNIRNLINLNLIKWKIMNKLSLMSNKASYLQSKFKIFIKNKLFCVRNKHLSKLLFSNQLRQQSIYFQFWNNLNIKDIKNSGSKKVNFLLLCLFSSLRDNNNKKLSIYLMKWLKLMNQMKNFENISKIQRFYRAKKINSHQKKSAYEFLEKVKYFVLKYLFHNLKIIDNERKNRNIQNIKLKSARKNKQTKIKSIILRKFTIYNISNYFKRWNFINKNIEMTNRNNLIKFLYSKECEIKNMMDSYFIKWRNRSRKMNYHEISDKIKKNFFSYLIKKNLAKDQLKWLFYKSFINYTKNIFINLNRITKILNFLRFINKKSALSALIRLSSKTKLIQAFNLIIKVFTKYKLYVLKTLYNLKFSDESLNVINIDSIRRLFRKLCLLKLKNVSKRFSRYENLIYTINVTIMHNKIADSKYMKDLINQWRFHVKMNIISNNNLNLLYKNMKDLYTHVADDLLGNDQNLLYDVAKEVFYDSSWRNSDTTHTWPNVENKSKSQDKKPKIGLNEMDEIKLLPKKKNSENLKSITFSFLTKSDSILEGSLDNEISLCQIGNKITK